MAFHMMVTWLHIAAAMALGEYATAPRAGADLPPTPFTLWQVMQLSWVNSRSPLLALPRGPCVWHAADSSANPAARIWIVRFMNKGCAHPVAGCKERVV